MKCQNWSIAIKDFEINSFALPAFFPDQLSLTKKISVSNLRWNCFDCEHNIRQWAACRVGGGVGAANTLLIKITLTFYIRIMIDTKIWSFFLKMKITKNPWSSFSENNDETIFIFNILCFCNMMIIIKTAIMLSKISRSYLVVTSPGYQRICIWESKLCPFWS